LAALHFSAEKFRQWKIHAQIVLIVKLAGYNRLIFKRFNNRHFFTNKPFANQVFSAAHRLRIALLKFCA
ncbi:hypothetical protein, partial [Escherichia coli]|uniref:hypothetical protein n=1 Tax=Escherichia coli TaxID=562 RepID=UPI001C4016F4